MKAQKFESKHASEILKRLKRTYPDAHCELYHKTPFQLLVATVLSAQCTDVQVNKVTPKLFEKYPGPNELASAQISNVEEIIKTIGFFRTKAKNIVSLAQSIVKFHNGKVPTKMEELIELAGVGRKTANVVLSNSFNIHDGVVVDTHVKRLSFLLGLTKHTDPKKIELDLMKTFPQKSWGELSHLLIFHGRRTCVARRPHCEVCPLADLCPSIKISKNLSKAL